MPSGCEGEVSHEQGLADVTEPLTPTPSSSDGEREKTPAARGRNARFGRVTITSASINGCKGWCRRNRRGNSICECNPRLGGKSRGRIEVCAAEWLQVGLAALRCEGSRRGC